MEVQRLAHNIAMYCHNVGISKRVDGHILENDEIYLGYGYGPSWGKWATRIHKLDYQMISGPITNIKQRPTLYAFKPNKENYIIGINVEPRTINIKTKQKRKFTVVGYNNNLNKVAYSKKLNYKYDESVIQIKSGQIIALNKGSTNVVIYNDDFYTTLKVNVD